MGTINDKIDYLDETKHLIKEALIEKNVPVSESDTFRSYADKISSIVGIDTSDATATANDILANKTAYADGEKITGTIPMQEQVITPSTQRQNISTGYHSNSYVEGVTAAIDSNIKSSNIKSGVSILGVEGNVEPDKPDQTKTVNPSTQKQIVEPDIGYELASVTVNPMQLESKTVTPSTLPQVINPSAGKDGINQVNVNAVDNTIDSNIKSNNIKSGVSILGVDGSVVEKNAQSKTVNPSTLQQVITPDNNYNSLDKVTVNAIQTESKTVKSTTQSQTITPTTEKYINEIIVNPIDLETKTVTPTTVSQTINPSAGKDGIGQINVNAVDSSIDSNIQAENIKNGVEILGVAGTLEQRENLDIELNAQDAALSAQESKIDDIQAALIGKYSSSSSVNLQSKDVTITENGTTKVEPDANYDGLSDVDITVNVPDSPDWTEIGYEDTPQTILDGFNYAKEIYDNWNPDVTSLNGKFKKDTNLLVLPYVDTSKVTNFFEFCADARHLIYIPLIDTSKATALQGAFTGVAIIDFPALDTSSCTNFSNAFSNNKSLKHFSTIDTSNGENFSNMFKDSEQLRDIEVLDLSSATNLTNMFASCSQLTDYSLNNIMTMCIGATAYTGTKTLKQLGINSSKASRATQLENYQAFLDAGWTTGY